MIYNENNLKDYLKNDWILDLLKNEEDEWSKSFRSHIWLTEMDNKRMIYGSIYGDLLQNKDNKKILDVGGGFSSLTNVLIRNHNYVLLDFFAHDKQDALEHLKRQHRKEFLKEAEWSEEVVNDYDIVIANDIFPDVDQRLELFIERYLPHCKELRLLLTYYNIPKWYFTKRIDDTEIMTFLSWDGEILALKLKKYMDRSNITDSELNVIKINNESIFQNGRQVCYVVLKGDL